MKKLAYILFSVVIAFTFAFSGCRTTERESDGTNDIYQPENPGDDSDNQGGTGDDNQGGTQGGMGSDNQGGNQGGTGNDNQGGTQGGAGGDNQGGTQGGTGSDNQGGNQGGAGNDNQGGNQGGAGNDNQGGNQGGTGNDNQGGNQGNNGDDTGMDDEKEDLDINVGSSSAPTYRFSSDGALVEVTRQKQSTVNTLEATDDFGRSFGATGGFDNDKYVCLFYFAWLGQHPSEMTGIYDISKLLDTNPKALWDDTNGNSSSPIGKYHHWGEPLYGYYNSMDQWVIRKHVELFVAAGIDVLVFDTTNAYCYFPVIEQVANVLRAYQNQGWKVPKFMFYTNTKPNETVRLLYEGNGYSSNGFERDGFYKKGNFSDLWFKPNGKPQIVTVSSALDAELKNYFDIWESTWPSGGTLGAPYNQTGFPWIDWTGAPGHKGNQAMMGNAKGGVMSVSVAQHNRAPFSNAVNTMNRKNLAEEQSMMWGRGYTKKGKANHTDTAINSGLNFEEEWEYAIAKNPKYIHVTGWNEWIAGKFVDADTQPDSGAFFVDTVNREYSRDVEMMKGGYADNFYLQLARNVRNYKAKSGALSVSAKQTVDIKKGLTQWNSVKNIYDDFAITKTDYAFAANRNALNFDGSAYYKDSTMRNDIVSVRVTNDDKYVYFLVECAADIIGTPSLTGNKFMNILIDVDGQDNSNALGGYDYIVNRLSSHTGDCGVEKISKTGNRLAYEQTGKGGFTLSGKYMQFRVSKRSLGIKTGENFTLGFKVADNVTDPEDISSYYCSGECAPVGRLSYTYKGN